MRRPLVIFMLFQVYLLDAQVNNADIYKDRTDTLASSVTSASGSGNFLSKSKDQRTEVITASGLCKMACCNLAESFENSASVSVGYSDAVTGARQIRLLGLSGVYTQMLDENRPVMRGIASPFGLNYVPGQWLNSIQIAKGSPSVINGAESLTGQINLEHRKPTDEIPFYANASIMTDTKADLNLASSLQLDKKGRWNTVLLGHISGNFVAKDHNGDSFVDDPKQMLVNVANRWLYNADNGTQLRFGFRYLYDDRNSGQLNVEKGWTSAIRNRSFNAYLKLGVPLNDDNTRNLAFVGDFNDYAMDGRFGMSSYAGDQLSGIASLLYQDHTFDRHHFTLGINAFYDHYDEGLVRNVAAQAFKSGNLRTDLVNAGAFGEYTFHYDDIFTAIAGLRGDWYNCDNTFRATPRLTLKLAPIDEFVIRFNGGRGLRNANPITDNIGVMSTGKAFYPNSSDPIYICHPLEDSWVVGGNVTWYLPIGAGDNNYVSFDYFRTQFTEQLVVDYNAFNDIVNFYMLSSIPGHQSYTNTYQLDFAIEPLKRFTINATFRYTDARITMSPAGLQERPMTSRYKGVLNLQYATNLNKWIFDVTFSVNGPVKVWDYMEKAYPDYYKNGLSPVYPLLYAQVTHRMKGWDIYIGGENLTNFKQPNPVINAQNPGMSSFDASGVWGPLMGIKGYLGVRVTLWKKS